MNTVEPIRDLIKIEAIKKILKAGSIRDWLLFTLGINSALRVSDLLRLRQADVYDDRGRILDSIRLRERKTAKEKVFRLNQSARKSLEEYIRTVEHEPGRYLFVSRKGENRAISRSQAWAIINRAAKDVGIRQPIGSHSLRKTWAYHAYKGGTDIELISAALNHDSARTTRRYIGIRQDDIDSVYVNVNL